jgi:membrane protease YdiL (CAAX protease family)
VLRLGAGLALLGNLKLWLAGEVAGGSLGGAAFGAGITALALRWAKRVGKLAPEDVGLGRAPTVPGQTRAALVGAAAGLGCGTVVVAMALGGVGRLGLTRHAPEIPASLGEMTEAELLRRVILFLPLDTVLPEEVAFRGVLLGALRRRCPVPAAVALAAVPFTFWHTALALQETPSRNLTHLTLKFAGYYVAGVGFGALREMTGALSSCLAAHWSLNATLMLLLHPAARRLVACIAGPRAWRAHAD